MKSCIHASLQAVKEIIRLKAGIYCAFSVTSLFSEVTVVADLRAKLPSSAWMRWAAGINPAAFCQKVIYSFVRPAGAAEAVTSRNGEGTASPDSPASLSTAGGGDGHLTGLQASVRELRICWPLVLADEIFCPSVFCGLVSWCNSASKEPFPWSKLCLPEGPRG